jgi:hypothetical protein
MQRPIATIPHARNNRVAAHSAPCMTVRVRARRSDRADILTGVPIVIVLTDHPRWSSCRRPRAVHATRRYPFTMTHGGFPPTFFTILSATRFCLARCSSPPHVGPPRQGPGLLSLCSQGCCRPGPSAVRRAPSLLPVRHWGRNDNGEGSFGQLFTSYRQRRERGSGPSPACR